jgi:hypothetical protein
MIVSKTNIKNKMLKILKEKKENKNNYGNKPYIPCSICGKEIEEKDIENLHFEYCKSHLGENYAHSKCVEKMINK